MLMPTSKKISTRCCSCILGRAYENIWDNFMGDSMTSPSLTPCRNHKSKDRSIPICLVCLVLKKTLEQLLDFHNGFHAILFVQRDTFCLNVGLMLSAGRFSIFFVFSDRRRRCSETYKLKVFIVLT